MYTQAEYHTTKFRRFKKKAIAIKKKQLYPCFRRRFWLFLHSAPLVMSTGRTSAKKAQARRQDSGALSDGLSYSPRVLCVWSTDADS